MTFNPGVGSTKAKLIQDIFEIKRADSHTLYLGLPTFSIRNKRLQFGYIRDRIACRLDSWKSKLFSAGGKEVLLKAVIQAIPTYTMSCFRIPEFVCADIDRLCARFWWGDSEDKNRIHWKKWKEMCIPKEKGGLGFRSLSSFNKALLAKQGWRIINSQNL